MVSNSKGASPKKEKQDVLVGRRVFHKGSGTFEGGRARSSVADGAKPRKSPHIPCVDCALFFHAIFQLRTDRRFSSHHLAPQTQNEAVPSIRNQGGASEELPDPRNRMETTSAWKKKAPNSQWDARTKPHWAGIWSRFEMPPHAVRSSSGRMLPHDVEVRAKVPSNRSLVSQENRSGTRRRWLENERLLQQIGSQVIGPFVNTFVCTPCERHPLLPRCPWAVPDIGRMRMLSLDFHRGKLVALFLGVPCRPVVCPPRPPKEMHVREKDGHWQHRNW